MSKQGSGMRSSMDRVSVELRDRGFEVRVYTPNHAQIIQGKRRLDVWVRATGLVLYKWNNDTGKARFAKSIDDIADEVIDEKNEPRLAELPR